MRSKRNNRQAGITLIGMLMLAAVFGVVGLGVLKIVPLYMEKMRIATVLGDLQTELASGGNTAQSIKYALDSRLYVENLSALKSSELEITRGGQGYLVSVNRESREPFLGDLHFLIIISEQVEIAR